MKSLLPSRRHLHALSRDAGVLTRAIAIVLGAFFLAALWQGARRGPPVGPPALGARVGPGRAEALEEVLQADPLDRVALARALRADAGKARRAAEDEKAEEDGEDDRGEESLDLAALVGASALPAAEQQAFAAWHGALRSGAKAGELGEQLKALAMPAAPRLPTTMAGDLLRSSRDYAGALAAYEAAGAFPDGVEARRRAVDLALSREWDEVTARLLGNADYYEAVHERPDALSAAAARHTLDVGPLWRKSLEYSFSLLRLSDYLFLSLLTGGVWFVSLHKACRLPRRQWWISLLGLPLGMLSTVVTLVLTDLQEARGGLADSEWAGPALLYQVAGVGLREELAKLGCFLPLLWWLRRGTPAQALMAASCTGLGVALKENIGYYGATGGAGMLTRFVTANFMHLAMSGLVGHALFRFVRYPKNYGAAFLATFCSMVLLHGFYNFSQGGHDNLFSRELSGMFPFMVAGLAWHYFQVVRDEQDGAPQALSAQAVFLLGTAVVLGTLLNFLVAEGGWEAAIHGLVPAALSSVLLGALFSHLLRDA